MTRAIDWAAAETEALEHFRNLLQIDTTNPPGNEAAAARYLAAALAREGIAAQLAEPAPGRANLVARLDGGDRARALLLASHTDVVAAEAQHWTHPPFAATVADGCVWGRGAVDMKHMTAFGLTTLLWLKRTGAPLARDVVLVAVADEEAGCGLGSKWLAEHRAEWLEGEYCLGEVGGFSATVGETRVYPIMVAEKGFLWLRVTVSGPPGHGSIPHPDNAIVRLARIVDRLGSTRLPFHRHPVVDTFLKTLGRAAGLPAGLVLHAALHGWLSDLVLDRVLPDRERARVFAASLHNTVVPTIIEGGRKENVIPSEASVVLDCRLLPGFSEERFLEELRTHLGDTQGLEFSVVAAGEAVETPIDTPLYETLRTTLERRDPGCIVTPYLLVGYTDAKAYSRLGIRTYGFAPLLLPKELEFSALFHGHDERVPVDGFRWGFRTFYEAVESFVTTRG